MVRSINFSFNAAKATETLIVEQGWKPPPRANFWLTIVRMRPVVGSTTTTAPLKGPERIDSRAAHREILAIDIVPGGGIRVCRFGPRAIDVPPDAARG